jgi:hypothetical protein
MSDNGEVREVTPATELRGVRLFDPEERKRIRRERATETSENVPAWKSSNKQWARLRHSAIERAREKSKPVAPDELRGLAAEDIKKGEVCVYDMSRCQVRRARADEPLDDGP